MHVVYLGTSLLGLLCAYGKIYYLLLLQGMAEIESTYASSVSKLLKSISYTFHSNVLMQWLGSEPFEELGYVMIIKPS